MGRLLRLGGASAVRCCDEDRSARDRIQHAGCWTLRACCQEGPGRQGPQACCACADKRRAAPHCAPGRARPHGRKHGRLVERADRHLGAADARMRTEGRGSIAQAHGAVDRVTGAAAAYSFYPTKNLGGIGDGGAVVTDDVEMAQRLRRLRAHGATAQYVHTEISQNFRMSEIESAWLNLTLPFLAADTQRRREIAAAYRIAAPHLLWQSDHERHVHHLAVVRSSNRDAFRAHLAAHDVGSSVHYPLALTQQPAYAHFTTAACPNAEAWSAGCVSVPMFAELSDAEVEAVCAALSGAPE